MRTLKSIGIILMVLVASTCLVSCGEDYHSRLPELLIKDMSFDANCDVDQDSLIVKETKEQVFRNEDLSNLLITTDVNWCWPHIDVENSKITVSVNGNGSYDVRTAIVTITDSKDNTTRTFKVTQTQREGIKVDHPDYSINSGGGEIPITVQSNVAYTVEVSDNSWIHYTSTRGLTTSTVIFTIDENNSGDVRYGTVKILNSDKSIEAKATIKQDFSPFFELSVKDITIDELGQEFNVNYNTNINLYIDTDYVLTWLEEGALDKTDETHFVQTYKAKPFTEKKAGRSVTLYFKGTKWNISDIYPDVRDRSVTVTQERTLYIPTIEDTESGKIEMYVGDSVLVNYVNSKKRTIAWSTNDKNIATVNEDGLVKAVSTGETTITLSSADGKYSDLVNVVVKKPDDITKDLSCEWAEEVIYNADEEISGYAISNTFINDSKFDIYVSKCRFYNDSLLVKERTYNSRTGKLAPGGALEMTQVTVAEKKGYYVEWDYTYFNEEYTITFTEGGAKTVVKKETEKDTTPDTPAATVRRKATFRCR